MKTCSILLSSHGLPAHPSLRAVSFEAELRAERVRSAALEARSIELGAALAAQQRLERLRLARCAVASAQAALISSRAVPTAALACSGAAGWPAPGLSSACNDLLVEHCACSELLGGRCCLRRVFVRWRAAAAEQARLRGLGEAAATAYRAQLLRKWLARWRLATRRSHSLAARNSLRQTALLQRAWAAWKQHCSDVRLRRALEVAADLHRQAVVLRAIVRAWQAHAASRRQVNLPSGHPTMLRAAQLQRKRLLAGAFQVRLHSASKSSQQ